MSMDAILESVRWPVIPSEGWTTAGDSSMSQFRSEAMEFRADIMTESI